MRDWIGRCIFAAAGSGVRAGTFPEPVALPATFNHPMQDAGACTHASATRL